MTRKALLPLVATATLTGSAGHILPGGALADAQGGAAGTDETAADLARLTGMAARFAPVDLVDIEPRFVTAQELGARERHE